MPLSRMCSPGMIRSAGVGVQALQSDLAADAVGVNTHLSYTGTIYDTSFTSIIKPKLLELGTRHIRDNPSSISNMTIRGRYQDLATNGIKTLLINWDQTDQGKNYVEAVNTTAGFQVIEAVEPPNERDNSGAGWEAILKTFMETMYPAYKGDVDTLSIPILGPSFANGRDAPGTFATAFPGAVSYMDYGNIHNYSGVYPEGPQGSGWGRSLIQHLGYYSALSGSKTIWSTENGFKLSEGVVGHPEVTQRAAAKYLPRVFLYQLKNNVPRCYIYQLVNNSEDFGIINTDGSNRLQFTSIKNYIAMFADPGSPFSPGTLNYSFTGTMTDIQHMLFQKRNGRFYVVVWLAVSSSSGGTTAGTAADIEPTARSLTLNLPYVFTTVNQFEPSFGTAAIATASNTSSVSLTVHDHILVVELIS